MNNNESCSFSYWRKELPKFRLLFREKQILLFVPRTINGTSVVHTVKHIVVARSFNIPTSLVKNTAWRIDLIHHNELKRQSPRLSMAIEIRTLNKDRKNNWVHFSVYLSLIQMISSGTWCARPPVTTVSPVPSFAPLQKIKFLLILWKNY